MSADLFSGVAGTININTGEGLEHLPCGYRTEHTTPSQQLAFEHLAAKEPDISGVGVGKQTKTELEGN